MTANNTQSEADNDFLAQCEEEFKHRYTENDKEFMKVFNSVTSTPPIVDPWFGSQGGSRRTDYRNRRDHSYEQHCNRGRARDYHDRRDNDRRTYSGYDSRRQGYQRYRPY